MADEIDEAFSVTEHLTQAGIHAVRMKARAVSVPVSVCEDCDNPIPAKRQKIVPGVRLCVYCQERKEKLEKHFSEHRQNNDDE
ncbi:conjugal transfer protein TraR [Salmonella enterica subsp. diarizonae]|nr:conjugal transfer protein TraR [Salmonella enterica]EBS5021832.1 conjugal transfer protein TraR [Salmonella enterica subsp. enterica serovar Hvittingfoss]EDU7995056.1 conjugal transfer protein TraR [Salmonella enterica subsp. diarizonae]EHV3427516.1 TraR/DksA C4-type zinc finger protein [Salmonella enterica]